MKRYDLRHLKAKFQGRFAELLGALPAGDVAIFMFEMGDFSFQEELPNLIKNANSTILNSLQYNQVDWMMVVKKG